ncbi:peptidoglycan DD-metalloendopeptidase family protein [Halioxenophilus aromaticivorans]|uniref:Peptidoglycan DD-metalloendopeptidase family protein n=1 Tax=Halioxenophilus aromaticivorans TaxID=1306992 RepID=A0AAV3U2G8_9ALTE
MKSLFDTCWAHFPKSHLVVTSGLTVCLTATLSLWPSKDAEAIRHDPETLKAVQQGRTTHTNSDEQTLDSNLETSSEQSLAPPDLTPLDANFFTETDPFPEHQLPDELAIEWNQVEVKSGENLSRIFFKVGLSATDLFRLINSQKEAKELTKLKPGEKLDFHISEDSKLQALRYRPNELETHVFVRNDDTFDFTKDTLTPEVRMTYRTATIDSSLFVAANEAGMDDNITMALADIFGWDVDFALDIRRGDDFKVLYEEQFIGDKKLGNGNIMAAEFTNRGKTFRAVRYTNPEGVSQYFTPDGQSMRKEFLRSPVDFARISSHFNLKRKHPVLNTIRAHKGTDYAAPTGTPIRAVGDGRVTFAGRNGGYGNVVKIQHGQTYQTRYAHLHKFRKGVRANSWVKQGDIIGYVGSTGLATGPHLHFEFYVNGAVRNPVTVKLPKAKSVPNNDMLRFAQQTQPLLSQLGYAGNSQLALKDDEEQKEQ